MAAEKDTTVAKEEPKSVPPVQPSKKKETKEATYAIEELIAAAKTAFGVQPEVVAGALHDSNKSELTKSEVKKAIEKFLKEEV